MASIGVNMTEEITRDKLKIIDLEKKLKKNLMALGFDFGLSGSHFIKDVLINISFSPRKIHSLSTEVMTQMATKENVSVKAIDKNIRWAINKAYNHGILNKITVFAEKMPTIKQLINWLYDFFICDVSF